MSLRTTAAILAGRAARVAARLRGGGAALPGRIALALDPKLIERAVAELPGGVVFVTGSNGKSTTTHFLTRIVRAHGLRVFTNGSGGNLPQGIASSVLPDVDRRGHLKADIAILEVDEAYGPQLIPLLHPRGALLLNIQVDQLNRFYDPARVAGFLRTIGQACGAFVVVNADDVSLRGMAGDMAAPVSWFGVRSDVAASAARNGLANYDDVAASVAEIAEDERAVQVTAVSGRDVTVQIDGREHDMRLPVRGLHYAVDAAGALETARRVLGDRFDAERAIAALSSAPTVYGRGELMHVGGEDIEIVMMKNAPSLQVNLDALDGAPEQLFVAVDEGTPDPSWIYGTDLSAIDHVDVLTGTKAWQLATRFGYGGVRVDAVEPDLAPALERFLALPRPTRGVKTMIVNYEQMMDIRRRLGQSGIEGKSNT
jgi:UDP-N-acetylmuramyl tripeptide synthase